MYTPELFIDNKDSERNDRLILHDAIVHVLLSIMKDRDEYHLVFILEVQELLIHKIGKIVFPLHI